jgi:hypothetical protein
LLLIGLQSWHRDAAQSSAPGFGSAPLHPERAKYLARLQRADESASDIANYLRTQDLSLVRQDAPANGEL